MWSLSLDDILRVREELKGRRAAIAARSGADAAAADGDEARTIDADLVEIESLERAAGQFVVKYKSDDMELEDIVSLVVTAEPGWDAAASETAEEAAPGR